jgi:hypothetical protein
VQARTLRNYLRAASDYFRVSLDLSVPICHPASGRILPEFEDVIGRVRRWQKPRARREPYSQEKSSALAHWVAKLHAASSKSFLGLVATVFDWVRLGIFTGSRGIEYCQTVSKRHQFAKVPMYRVAGIFQGTPLAFMGSDFTFFDAAGSRVALRAAFRHAAKVV